LVSAMIDAERVLRPVEVLIDDRDAILPGDPVFLIIENDVSFARILLSMARDKGFKGLVAGDGESGLALANRYRPQTITLDLKLPILDGWTVLDRLKRNPDTRHIPVHVISVVDREQHGEPLGAVAYLEKPVSQENLESIFTHLNCLTQREMRTLLLVEDDAVQRSSLQELLEQGGLEVQAVSTGADALAALAHQHFDCMVLDLVLPDMSGAELLANIKAEKGIHDLPVLIYTSKELDPQEITQLRACTKSIIVKGADSAELLLSETRHSLRRLESAPVQELLAPGMLTGRKVLVVDDDARNIFALASVLESHDIEVLYAENGLDGINMLKRNPDINLVLMDVMMPGMDGYETMQEIRKLTAFASLPIIALTAKAMPGDREKCIEAGASDYIPKPVDTELLLMLMSRWLDSRDAAEA